MKNLFKITLIIPFLISVITCKNLYSQEIARNNVYLEAGGSSILYSINYERLLSKNREINFPFRIGFSYLPENKYLDINFPPNIPVSLGLVKQMWKNSFFETKLMATTLLSYENNLSERGLGDTTNNFVYREYLKPSILPGLSIGYRRQPTSSGFFLNGSIQLMFPEFKQTFIWIGVGLGYTF